MITFTNNSKLTEWNHFTYFKFLFFLFFLIFYSIEIINTCRLRKLLLDLSLKFTAHSLKHATYFVKNIWRTIALILKSFKNSINMQLEACHIIVHSKEVRPVHLRTRSGKKMHCGVGFFLAIKMLKSVCKLPLVNDGEF